MRVAEAIAASLSAHGVSCLFGVLGDGNLPVLDVLVHRHGADYVPAAREDGAVLMADGYARVTGGLGVATVTHGPALTNAVTALTEAARARTPLILLAADTPPGDRRNPQDIDQADVVRPTGAGVQQVHTARSAPTDVARAVRRAHEERRPIVLNVPTPLLGEGTDADAGGEAGAGAGAEVGKEAGAGSGPYRRPEAAAPRPDPREVGRVADAIAAAERPVIVAGRGAMESGARAALVALSARLGAPLATTLKAKGYFAGEPYDIGVCGGFATGPGRDLIRRADLLLAFGAGLNTFTTDAGRMLHGPHGSPKIVHNDVRPAAFGAWTPADVAVLGDARALAEMLDAELDGRGVRRAVPPPEPYSYEKEFADGSDETGLDPHAVVAALERMVPRDRTLVVEGGHAALSEPCRGLSVPDPASFVFPVNFGSIGLGLASAIGAAVARPDRVTLSVAGDGALMMGLAELDTAVRRRLPLLLVVMNDAAYGYEYHNMRHRGLDVGLSLIPRPDFAAVARSFGATGLTVRTPAELDDLKGVIAGMDGPVLVDARLTREVRTRWFAEHENGFDPLAAAYQTRYDA